MKKRIYYGALIFFLGVLAYSRWMIWQTCGEYNEAEVYYEDLPPRGNYRIQIFSGDVSNVKDSAWQLDFTDEGYEACSSVRAIAPSEFGSRRA